MELFCGTKENPQNKSQQNESKNIKRLNEQQNGRMLTQ